MHSLLAKQLSAKPVQRAVKYSSSKRCSRALKPSHRSYATPASEKQIVSIVEVGPRDGLQNELNCLPVDVRAEFIDRLGSCGLTTIEAGSFVSPKWVPQMVLTDEVLKKSQHVPDVHYPVLVPNMRGLELLLDVLSKHPTAPSKSIFSRSKPQPLTDEIAIFTAATDAFSKSNTNCTVKESLERLAPVAERAAKEGLRVRGYVSVVIECPYSGAVDYKMVRDVSKALRDMGCYEVSLGDTTGKGVPHTVCEMIDVVKEQVPVEMLAGHFHDTYGMGVANILASLDTGIRTFDSSVAGLGGCPYSPGATGNVATEDVVHALISPSSPYTVRGTLNRDTTEHGTLDLGKIVETGVWISNKLGRPTESRAGRGYWAVKKFAEHKKLLAEEAKQNAKDTRA